MIKCIMDLFKSIGNITVTWSAVAYTVDPCQFDCTGIDVHHRDRCVFKQSLQCNANDTIPASKVKYVAMQLFFTDDRKKNFTSFINFRFGENTIICRKSEQMPRKPERMILPVFDQISVVGIIVCRITWFLSRAEKPNQ